MASREFLRRNAAVVLTLIFLLPSLLSAHASNRYSLTVTYNGSGIVTRNPNFQQYPEGAVVALTARPDPGWLFSHWSGDADGSSNPIQFEISGPTRITANFVETPTYALTTAVTGQGTINLAPPGGNYSSNTVVQLTASPAAGWVFSHWTGDASGSANPLSLMMNNHKTTTAHFAELVAITQAPQNVMTNSGSTVTFTVQARGTGPLSYSWKFGTEPISGANSSTLSLTNVQANDQGSYSVTVSGTHNNASASAELTLTDAPCTGTNVVTTPSEAALRAAIEAGGYVRLCFNGTITLTNAITISKDVALDATARNVTISGNNASRHFIVQTNVTLAITNLTLTEGRHRGPNDPAGGQPGFGGSIWNQGGTLILTQCSLSNNAAIGGNGTGDVVVPGGAARGGAIFNEFGSINIKSSVISSNTAVGGNAAEVPYQPVPAGDGWGGGLASVGGSVHLLHTRLQGNVSASGLGTSPGSAAGGALFLKDNTGTLSNCLVTANSALGSGEPNPGAIILRGPTPGGGGGIRVQGGQLTLFRCIISTNVARGGSGGGRGELASGGGIYSDGAVSLIYSTIEGNQALGGNGRNGGAPAEGGGWYNAGASSASESLFSGNLVQGGNLLAQFSGSFFPGSSSGGAIANSGALVVTNITLAGNVARAAEAQSFVAYSGLSAGGGVYSRPGSTLSAFNLTIASNSLEFIRSPNGGQFLGANVASSNASVTLRNSIIAYPNGTNQNVHGPITDSGHNMSSDGSANFNSGTSFNLTDPRLDPLADNGGPTLTMALRPNSPAIDFGSSNSPTIDQRGFSRPSGNGVDIGAFEYAATAGITPNLGIQLQQNGRVLIWFVDGSNNNYELQSSTNLLNWQSLETFNGSTELSREYNADGSARFFRVIQR